MADVDNQQESALPVKRKPDLCCQEQGNIPNKAQKLQPLNSAASESKDGENRGSELGDLDSSAQEKVDTKSSNTVEKAAGSQAERDENGVVEEHREEEEEQEEADDGEEGSRREAGVDRKGKGIPREDKGKGKLVEEEDSEDDEDSDDDSSDGRNESDGDSDLSDDPLAEVDLDNILPSRTRRRSMQPGLYIPDAIGNEDDDDSDDSDA